MNKNTGRAIELFFIALLAFTLLTCSGGDEKVVWGGSEDSRNGKILF